MGWTARDREDSYFANHYYRGYCGVLAAAWA